MLQVLSSEVFDSYLLAYELTSYVYAFLCFDF